MKNLQNPILSVSMLILIFVLSYSCKKDDNNKTPTPTPTPQTSTVCDGNGKNTYFPLDSANTWNYQFKMMGSTQQINPSLFVDHFYTFYGKKYVIIEDASGWMYVDYVALREDSVNHNIYRYFQTDCVEYIEVPANPTLNQTWNTYGGTRKVTNLAATLITPSCSYTGLLEITQTLSSGDTTIFYYKKGLGLVAEISPGTFSSEYKLTSVSIK